jgi:hypothetical protein
MDWLRHDLVRNAEILGSVLNPSSNIVDAGAP